MSDLKIKRALVSVSNKDNLEKLVEYFKKYKITVLSSGGTYSFLKNLDSNLLVQEISKFTNFQEILDGRVKTLHPLIHGGILAKKDNPNHIKQLQKLKIYPVDLVVVNLYPFEQVSSNQKSSENECIENIDIGGPSLIRAAAKNFENVNILTSPKDYSEFIKQAESNQNSTKKIFRKKLAKLAFQRTAYYESLIANWFSKSKIDSSITNSALPLKKISSLRYGENPHQKGELYKLGENSVTKISGKDLSFNNINDLEIAMELAEQFPKSSCVILKHGNPCGVAIDKSQNEAYKKALSSDPVSAFGGIVAFNEIINEKTAQLISKIFTEIVVAPEFSSKAATILSTKKNLILVKYASSKPKFKNHYKSTRNFLLVQERDIKKITKNDIDFKTTSKLKEKKINDMIFAFTVCKYINSNAIVLSNNLQTVGIGVGQTNRLDSAKQAIKRMRENFDNVRPVLASDGFFPFPDIVKLCSKNNISGIIQPGGSNKDEIVIKESEKHKIPMAFTGFRHFKH